MIPENEMLRPEINKALEKAKRSRSLDLGSMTLTEKELNECFAFLTQHDIHTLNLANSKLDIQCIQSLANFLKTNTTLRYLQFGFSDLTPEKAEILREALELNKTLIEMYGIIKYPELEKLIKRNVENKRAMDLDAKAKHAAETKVLEIPTKLTEAELKTWLIPLLQDKTLMLTKLENLLKVDFETTKELMELFETALATHDTLTSMELFVNKHTKHLVLTLLKDNKKLTKIKLEFQFGMVDTISEIAQLLKDNTTLNTLDLSDMHFSVLTPTEIQKLIAMLKINKTLTTFNNSAFDNHPEILEVLKQHKRDEVTRLFRAKQQHGQPIEQELLQNITHMAGIASAAREERWKKEKAQQTDIQQKLDESNRKPVDRILSLISELKQKIPAMGQLTIVDVDYDAKHKAIVHSIIEHINKRTDIIIEDAKTKYVIDTNGAEEIQKAIESIIKDKAFKEIVGVDHVIDRLKARCDLVIGTLHAQRSAKYQHTPKTSGGAESIRLHTIC